MLYVRLKRQIIFMLVGVWWWTTNPLYGQTSTSLYDMYRENQVLQLKKIANENKVLPSEWKLFIQAVFEKDADLAMRNMMSIYSGTADINLQRIIRERIANYYFARGYYETSQRIMRDEAFFDQVLSVKKSKNSSRSVDEHRNDRAAGNDKILYGVQTGAFTTYDNAQRVKRRYERFYSNTTVLEKNNAGKALYIVLIGGYQTREEAEEVQEKIEQQFNINGYIIQY